MPDIYQEVVNQVQNMKVSRSIHEGATSSKVLLSRKEEVKVGKMIVTETVCFLWLSLPDDYRVTDEALLAETM